MKTSAPLIALSFSAPEWEVVLEALQSRSDADFRALAERIDAALSAPKPVDGTAYEAKYLQKALATRHA